MVGNDEFITYEADVNALRETIFQLFVKGLGIKSPSDGTKAATTTEAKQIIAAKNEKCLVIMKKKAFNTLKGTMTKRITDLRKTSQDAAKFNGYAIVVDKAYECTKLPIEATSIRLLWSQMKNENDEKMSLYKLLNFKEKGELMVDSKIVNEVLQGESLEEQLDDAASSGDEHSDSSNGNYQTPVASSRTSLLSRMASKLTVPTFDVDTDNIAEISEVLLMLDDLDNGRSTKLLVINFCQQNGLIGLLTNLTKDQKSVMKNFVKALKSRYEKKQRTLNLKQKKSEDEADFIHRVERQFRQIKGDSSNKPLSDESKKLITPYFVDGLRDQSIRMLIRRDEPEYEDLASTARKYRQCQEAEDLLPKNQNEIISMLSQEIQNLRTDINNGNRNEQNNQNNGENNEQRNNQQQSPRRSPNTNSPRAQANERQVCQICGRGHRTEECNANARDRANFNRGNRNRTRRNQNFQIRSPQHQQRLPVPEFRQSLPRPVFYDQRQRSPQYQFSPFHHPRNYLMPHQNVGYQRSDYRPTYNNQQSSYNRNQENIANNNQRSNQQNYSNQRYNNGRNRSNRGRRQNRQNQPYNRARHEVENFQRHQTEEERRYNSYLTNSVEAENDTFLY